MNSLNTLRYKITKLITKKIVSRAIVEKHNRTIVVQAWQGYKIKGFTQGQNKQSVTDAIYWVRFS